VTSEGPWNIRLLYKVNKGAARGHRVSLFMQTLAMVQTAGRKGIKDTGVIGDRAEKQWQECQQRTVKIKPGNVILHCQQWDPHKVSCHRKV
jgi:hypothetical protein